MDVVFGGTGLVGGDIVRRLREAGRPVRAGLRGGITHPKAEALGQAGVEVVEGDLTRAATLEGACQGARTVVTTVTSMPTGEHDGLRRVDLVGTLALIDAAERAGCQRFIYVSFSGGLDLDSPLQLAKRSCERHLAASRMEAVVLRPSAFMEVWLGLHLGFDPANGVVHLNGTGAAPIRFISAFDVAAIAAKAVLHPDPGGIWELGGPEAIAPLEVVQLFERKLGKPIAVIATPAAELLEAYEAASDPLAKTFAALKLGLAQGDPVPGAAAAARQFGVTLTSVEEFAARG
jgi:NADH dehydrogenase